MIFIMLLHSFTQETIFGLVLKFIAICISLNGRNSSNLKKMAK